MRLRLVQFSPDISDKEANLTRILDHIDRGLEAKANLIAFGECALVGYELSGRVRYHEVAEPIPGPATERVAARLKGKNCLVLFGMAENDRGDIYNAAPIVGPGGVVGVARKLYLANFASPVTGTVFSESVHFKPGRRITIVDTEFGRIGLAICYDIIQPEIARAQALAGCWLVLVPYAMPLATNSSPAQSPFAITRAHENAVCLAGVNLVGDQGGQLYGGGSCVIVERQGVKAHASLGKEAREDTLQYDIDPAEIYAARAHYPIPILRDARPDLMKQLWQIAEGARPWADESRGGG